MIAVSDCTVPTATLAPAARFPLDYNFLGSNEDNVSDMDVETVPMNTSQLSDDSSAGYNTTPGPAKPPAAPLKDDLHDLPMSFHNVLSLDAAGLKAPPPFRTPNAREQWARDNLPADVMESLDKPFGKSNLDHSFTPAQATFRHCLLPLFQSGFLSKKMQLNLERAAPLANQLGNLLRRLRKTVDFTKFEELRGFQPHLKDITEFPHDWSDRLTAALLFKFCGNTAPFIRWMGGVHTGEHRNHAEILRRLKPAVEPELWDRLRDLYIGGAPSKAIGEYTEAGYQAAVDFGNHPSVEEHKPLVRKAMLKDTQRQFVLPLVADCHPFVNAVFFTPLNIVYVAHPFKKARLIWSATMELEPGHAVNTWTDKSSGIEVRFPGSLKKLLTWIYNMRLTYPDEEIYPCDDDVTAGFKHLKFSPDTAGMNSTIFEGTLYLPTGGHFGGCAHPGHFEIYSLNRQQYAVHIWYIGDDLYRIAVTEYNCPDINIAPEPTPEEVATFQQFTADSKNTGVLDPQGIRMAPQYDHHVDDNMYAEIRRFLRRSIAAAIISLYTVFGLPNHSVDALSREKFAKYFEHIRRMVGWLVNTRRGTLALPKDKAATIITLLTQALAAGSMTLLEAAQLHGCLNHATYVSRRGRSAFLNFQNQLRTQLRTIYHATKGVLQRKGYWKPSKHIAPVGEDIEKHLGAMCLEKEVIRLLWRTTSKFKLQPATKNEFARLVTSLETTTWEISIAHLVDRDPYFDPTGDASGDAGGGYVPKLKAWCYFTWSDDIPVLKDSNVREFVTSIMLLIMIIAAMEAGLCPDAPLFPPAFLQSDNIPTTIWITKLSTKTHKLHPLVTLLGELMERTTVTLTAAHIKGDDNGLADDISRPKLTKQSFQSHYKQLLQKNPLMASWTFFQPSPEILRLIRSLLCSASCSSLPVLPENLGRFVPASSISSCSSGPCV